MPRAGRYRARCHHQLSEVIVGQGLATLPAAAAAAAVDLFHMPARRCQWIRKWFVVHVVDLQATRLDFGVMFSLTRVCFYLASRDGGCTTSVQIANRSLFIPLLRT